MIRTKQYKLYNIQVRGAGELTVVPVGANNINEAIGILLGMGYKRNNIIGEVIW